MIVADLCPLAVDIERLSALPRNPRRGDVEAVARSLDRFGQRKPVVARRDGTVIAGNHTLTAARQLGWHEIAVVWVDDDDATAKGYALADNRTAELGTYDDADLVALIEEVQAADGDLLAATGWTDADFEALLAASQPPPAPVALNDPDAAPAAPREAFSKPGDLWLIGEHRVLCGDCTDPTGYDVLLGGERVDCVWTDPPYGVDYVGKTAEALTLANDALGQVALTGLLRAAFGAALAVTRPGASWYVAAPHGPAGTAFGTALLELDVWRHSLVWLKDSFVMGRSDYHYRHEAIFYGWTPGAAHHALGDRTQDTVWEVPRPKASREHPTMKPVALITRAIENSTDAGAVILDPFGGSGSTLIAAHDTSRIARLVELDPIYVDVICRRAQEHMGVTPVLSSSGEPHDFAASTT